MQTHYDAELKDTVRYLGKTLGETIKNQLGQEWLDRIEKIRKGGRASYQGDATCSEELKETFKTMSDSDLLTVGRAFAQFLNLGNIAEQEYNAAMNVDASIDALFKHLDKAELTAEKVQDAVAKLNIDLVLTAHPTEVTRRTLIHKHKELANCLQAIHQESLKDVERKKIETRIADLIAQAWHTEEIRSVRPTPVDEARWGFSVIENSLYSSVLLPNLTLKEATYKYPHAVFILADKTYYRKLLNSVADDLLLISPLIENTGQILSNRNCIYMSLSGLEKIYKTYKNLEVHILNSIPEDLQVRIGI